MPNEKEIMTGRQAVLDRVVSRITDGMTEADGLRLSEHEGGVQFKLVPSDDPDQRFIGATVDGVNLSISIGLTP